MDMDQLRLFVAVARSSSMSRSASELNISQSAVSQSISRMEDELGVKLFTRKYRGLILCDEGCSFFSHAINILSELDEARREIKEQKGVVAGTIRLRVLVASALIPRLLYEFLHLYPQVQFEMVESLCLTKRSCWLCLQAITDSLAFLLCGWRKPSTRSTL